MKVHELIEVLKSMDQDANVQGLYDGAMRMDIARAWMSNSGICGLGQIGSVVYQNEDRPVNAPTEADDKYWEII